MASRRPQRLAVIIKRANGADVRFGAGPGPVANRATGIKFSTRLMEGFAEGQFTIPRSTLVGIELSIYDTVQFVTDTGRVVYEGRVAGLQLEDANRVTVLTGSWMSHGRDRPLAPYIYLVRDAQNWGQVTAARMSKITVAGYSGTTARVEDGGVFIFDEGGLPFTATALPWAGLMYEAPPGAFIDELVMTYGNRANYVADPNRHAYVLLGNSDAIDDGAGTYDISADLAPTAGTLHTVSLPATKATRHWASVECSYGAAVGGSDNYERSVGFFNPVVIGPHKLTRDANNYLRVSDIIKHSAAQAAPLLDTTAIPDTPYRVAHCRVDDPTDPYDLWLAMNRYELKNLAVWTNRQLTYTDIDRDAVNWQITGSDPNTSVRFDGPQAGQQINGMMVRFQNVLTTRADIVTPTTNPTQLADTSPSIPANMAGVPVWEKLQLPDPDTPTGAARYGEVVMAAFNRQKRPGKATVFGTIRNGFNADTDAMLVRAGTTVLVTDEVTNGGSAPRLIVETTYTDETQRLDLTIDGTSQDADALLADLQDAGKINV